MYEPRVWITKRVGAKGNLYALRWLDETTGTYKSKTAGRDRRAAVKQAALIEDQLRTGAYLETRSVAWHDFADEHLARLEGSHRTAKDVRRTLDAFGDVCKPAGPHRVNFRMIEAFVDHLRAKGNSVATRNKHLRYFRAALNMAVARDYIIKSPMVGWKWAKEDCKIPRALSDAEVAKLLKACPTDQWRTFVYVALTTGCRRGELLALTWNRVRFDRAEIVVTQTKGRKDRVQPLVPEAVSKLRKLQAQTLKDGGPFCGICESNMPHVFKAIVTAAGIDACTIHDLRRTFCTDLARLGVNQAIVQRLAGHASMATTAKFYIGVNDAMRRDAVAKLAKRIG